MSLDVVRGAIARPPSGFALEQLARAEHAIDAARAVSEHMGGFCFRCGVRPPCEELDELATQLEKALSRLDAAMSPHKEVSSSVSSEPQGLF